MTTYVPHTETEIKEMLGAIGVHCIKDLFADIPEELRLKSPLNMPKGMSEAEMVRKLTKLSKKNTACDEAVCFLGGGAYDHIIPAAVKHIISRGDFYTAYTPYQAEVSQGTLQTIYEYQSLICSLTGMDTSNASLYEGATANVEAIKMAEAQIHRTKVLLAETLNPEYRKVINTINGAQGTVSQVCAAKGGQCTAEAIAEAADEETAAVVVQYPNYFGQIEDIEKIAEAAHSKGALCIVCANPAALGLLEAPGKLGADIVTGEGQPLGISLSFGGPYLGFIACTKKLMRKLSGRIVGKTTDVDGKTGYVLTLQAREQHIRREKASSNICSNQALMALSATVYLTLMGSEGLKDVAYQSFQKAHYMQKKLSEIKGVSFPFAGPFFHEMTIKVPNAAQVIEKMAEQGYYAGILLEKDYPEMKDCMITAVTEKRTKAEIDEYCRILGGLIK